MKFVGKVSEKGFTKFPAKVSEKDLWIFYDCLLKML